MDIKAVDMSLFDWFATFAPEPTEEEVRRELLMDKSKNPHNEYNKPRRRSELEIKCDLRYEYAKNMVRAKMVRGV